MQRDTFFDELTNILDHKHRATRVVITGPNTRYLRMVKEEAYKAGYPNVVVLSIPQIRSGYLYDTSSLILLIDAPWLIQGDDLIFLRSVQRYFDSKQLVDLGGPV